MNVNWHKKTDIGKRLGISSLAKKCKVQWLKQGDQNRKNFHSILKAMRKSNRIFNVKDIGGCSEKSIEGIVRAFTDFYTNLLTTHKKGRQLVCSELVRREDL